MSDESLTKMSISTYFFSKPNCFRPFCLETFKQFGRIFQQNVSDQSSKLLMQGFYWLVTLSDISLLFFDLEATE